MTITRTTNAASRAQSIAALKKFLAESEPTAQPDVLLAQETKIGIVDKLLFDKSKPDKNGVYSNVKIVKKSFNSLKDYIQTLNKDSNIPLQNECVIAYQPINDKYHYILIRKLNITKDNIEKYLLLL